MEDCATNFFWVLFQGRFRNRGRLKLAAFGALAATLSLASYAALDISKLPAPVSRPINFQKDIQPLFEQTCLKCHNPEKAKSKLVLNTREHTIKGGEDGPDIVPGDSAHSRLIHLVAGLVPDTEMPPTGKGTPLTPEQIALLRAWIDQGAQWPKDLVLHEAGPTTAVTVGAGTPAAPKKDTREHWAFKPPVKPKAPEVKNTRWARNTLDRFVLEKLEKEGLKP